MAIKRLSIQPKDDFYKRYCNMIIKNNNGNIEREIEQIVDKIKEINNGLI